MAPGGGNLERAPRLLLATDVRESRPTSLPRHRSRHRRRGLVGRPCAPEEAHHVGEGRGAHDVQPFDLRRLASVRSGNDDALQPLARSLDRHGQHAGRRHELSLERQLSGERVPGEERRGHLGGGGQHPHGHGQIEPGALLPKVAGREVDDDATQRPFEPRALDRRADAIAVASRTAAPGSPVRVSDGSPRPTWASTVTRWPPDPEHRHPEHASVHASTRRSAVHGGP